MWLIRTRAATTETSVTMVIKATGEDNLEQEETDAAALSMFTRTIILHLILNKESQLHQEVMLHRELETAVHVALATVANQYCSI